MLKQVQHDAAVGGRLGLLRNSKFHQLDRLRIAHRPAQPLGCVEMHVRLVREWIAQDVGLRPLGNQIARLEITEGNAQAVRPILGMSSASTTG